MRRAETHRAAVLAVLAVTGMSYAAPEPGPADVAGEVIFHGRYQHTNTGRQIPEPAKLWLKQAADGAITAIADCPFLNSIEFAAGSAGGGFESFRSVNPAVGSRPGAEVKLAFEDGQVRATRRGLRADWDDKILKVPPGAWFDPNTRPDPYCAANLLLRASGVKPGMPKEFRVFDWDNTGDALADYTIAVEDVGEETVDVPAGTFRARHIVLKQKTSADTWFKKRAGHITDFWLLENQVIVRIRRNREPYEVALMDYSVPEKLPGHIAGPPSAALADSASPTNYAADWAAFVREVDRAYPFFELKGIRRDWNEARGRLTERVKTCAASAEFLAIVSEAILALRDSHMGLSEWKGPAPKFPATYYPGVSFMPATERRVAVMSAERHADKLKPGTVVTRIDGRDARAVLEEKAKEAWGSGSPYWAAYSSPQRARLFAYRWPLATATNRTHTLRYQEGERELELTVTCDLPLRGWPHTYNLPADLVTLPGRLAHTQLASGAGYIYLRSVNAETAPGIAKSLAAHPEAKGWVIDLRGNSGGGYDSDLLAQIKALPRPVAVLIDAGCISAGETLARDLVQLADARLMGALTAGASSSKRQWRFPSGLASVTFSTRSRWRSDGQPIEFNGIPPQEEIEAVPEEVAKGLNSEILRAEEWLARQ